MGDGTMGRIMNEEGTVIQLRDRSLLEGVEAEKIKETQRVVYGANLHENEYGLPLYADFFFFITGFHGTHVLSGVIINLKKQGITKW